MSKEKRVRGFEVVSDKHRTAFEVFTDEKGRKHQFPITIKLPVRADAGSAGYDFFLPKDLRILPNQKVKFFTDVKAYMQTDEQLKIFIRSSLGINKDLRLANGTGIVDSTYYNNIGNDGNIGVCLVNTSGKTIDLSAGERVVQGIFEKYLVADNDEVLHDERIGGSGSSDR